MIVHEGADRPIALGAIDGRNTKLDDTKVVAQSVDRVMEALDSRGVAEVHLQPSCGLEFLPRDRAKRKLERMREIADTVTKATT
jgi:methionine synthase II (cobalamin-independent)